MAAAGGRGVIPELLRLIEEASGRALPDEDWKRPFPELGLDSLFLTQLSHSIGARFGKAVSFRQLTTDLDSLAKLALHLDRDIGDAPAAPPWEASSVRLIERPSAPPAGGRGPDPDALIQMFMGQLEVMQQQLRMLAEHGLDWQDAGTGDGSVAEGTPPSVADDVAPPVPASVADLPAAPRFDAGTPPIPGARLGRDASGKPAWFVPDPKNPRKYVALN